MSRIEKALDRAARNHDMPRRSTREPFKSTDKPITCDEIDISPGSVASRIITVHEPESAISEHYRRLKIKLRLIRQRTKSVLFTSAVKGEGKSTTWLNMAVTMARDPNWKVVAVNADLRQHESEQLVPVQDSPGLTDVVLGKASLAESVRPTSIEGLFLLPSGTHVQDPVELISLPEMGDTLRKLTARHDCVLIDSPPVLAVTDPTVLGTLVDSVVLVVRATKTSRTSVEQAISMLDKSEIAGFVFNDAPEQSNEYYYRYYQERSKKEK